MAKFTDLLDEYLAAKAEVAAARKGYEGYDFSYFFARECNALEEAEKALNDFVEQAMKEKSNVGS